MLEEKREKKGCNKKKNRFIPILLWSLLVHLILLILILIFAFKRNQIIALFKAPPPPPKKNEAPASLKPRQSNFGTTVFFDDRAQFKKPKADVIADKSQDGEKSSGDKKEEKPLQSTIKQEDVDPKLKKQDDIKTQEKEKPTPVEKKVEQKIEKELEKPDGIPKTEEKEVKKQKEPSEVKDEQNLEKQAPVRPEPVEGITERTKQAETEKRIKEIEQLQKQIEQAKQIKTQKIRNFGVSQKNASPIQPRKKSIISMTKGFVENLKHKGNDWLERKGDDNKRPSFEELKYLSYEQKINWHLQNCWKRNFARTPTQRSSSGRAVIEFKIDLKGYVHDLNLLQTSGDSMLDHMILQSVSLAAPFPPLPKHFGKSIYKTGRIIVVSQQLNRHRFNFNS